MTKQEEFLDLYRQYESLLRNHNSMYSQVEENANDSLQNQLRITRQMRNFLSHNDSPSFLTISDKQIQLLQQLIQTEQEKDLLLKHCIQSPAKTAVKEHDTIQTVMTKLCKHQWNNILIYNHDCILGTLNIYQLSKLFMKTKSIHVEITRQTYGRYDKQFLCFAPETPMQNIYPYMDNETIICCTSDGTANGHFLGTYQK